MHRIAVDENINKRNLLKTGTYRNFVVNGVNYKCYQDMKTNRREKKIVYQLIYGNRNVRQNMEQ